MSPAIVYGWFMIGTSHFVTSHAGAIPDWLGELEGLEDLRLSNDAFEGGLFAGRL